MKKMGVKVLWGDEWQIKGNYEIYDKEMLAVIRGLEN